MKGRSLFQIFCGATRDPLRGVCRRRKFFSFFSLPLFSLSFLYVGDRFHISLHVYVVRVYKFIHRLFIKLLQNYYIVRVRACYFTYGPKRRISLSLSSLVSFVYVWILAVIPSYSPYC